MKYQYAFDLGTNSLGWAVFMIENDQKILCDCGVRIFHDGREVTKNGSVGDSLAVERRNARGMRRVKDRRQNRKKQLLNYLQSLDMLPMDKKQLDALFQQPKKDINISPQEHAKINNPYYRRYLAATDKNITRYDLGMAIYHLGVRRGFQSNRKSNEENESEFKEKINKLHDILKDHATLGCYLWHVYHQDTRTAIRLTENSQIHTDRALYKNEFDQIRQMQLHHLNDEQWDKIYHLIFFQRPLKPQEKGKCTFEPNEERAHADCPSSILFRIYQEINNLKIINHHNETCDLTQQQRDAIIDKLLTQKSISFNAIKKLKDKNKQPLFASDIDFNLEQGKRDKLHGFTIDIDMTKDIPNFWGNLSLTQKDNIIELLHSAVDNQDIDEYCHAHFSNITNEELEFLHGYAVISKTMNLSLKAINNILPYLKNGLRYDEAVKQCYPHHSYFDTGEIHSDENGNISLPYYGKILTRSTVIPAGINNSPEEKEYGKIANPTVHVALNQLRSVTNALIKRFGAPDEIHLEVSRDLKLTRQKRDEITINNRVNEKENKKIEKEYQGEFGEQYFLKPQDRKKYLLWQELQEGLLHPCIYCGNNIGTSLLYNGGVEIEHILPFSQTLDNSMNNLTLAHRQCNQDKGNRTPYDAFCHSSNTKYQWHEIVARANKLPLAKRKKFAENALEKWQQDGNDFIARQQTDTAYITKAARSYLTAITGESSRVIVNSGKLTALIRAKWGLNRILSNDNDPIKNRDDHRHHAIDAFVIGMIDRSLIQKIATESGANNDIYSDRIIVPELPNQLRESLIEKCQNMLISYKKDHGHNKKFYAETAYGYIKEKAHDFIGNEKDKYRWVTRKPFASLSKSQIFAIRDKEISDNLKQFITQQSDIEHIENDKDLKTIDDKHWQRLLAEFSNAHNIKTIRIKEIGNSMFVPESANYKGYNADNYICCDIYQSPKINKKRKFTGEFEQIGQYCNAPEMLRYDRAKKKSKNAILDKPHPAAKFLLRVYKNDIIHCKDKYGETAYWRVAGFSATNNGLDIRPLNESNGKQNFKSINQLSNITLINISPDGHIIKYQEKNG